MVTVLTQIITWVIYKDFPTLTYPPNFNVCLVLQFWSIPMRGRLFSTTSDVDYWYPCLHNVYTGPTLGTTSTLTSPVLAPFSWLTIIEWFFISIWLERTTYDSFIVHRLSATVPTCMRQRNMPKEALPKSYVGSSFLTTSMPMSFALALWTHLWQN